MAIILKVTNRPMTTWACEWKPSWSGKTEWATTGSVDEAKQFASEKDALDWAAEHEILLFVQAYTFTLEPLR